MYFSEACSQPPKIYGIICFVLFWGVSPFLFYYIYTTESLFIEHSPVINLSLYTVVSLVIDYVVAILYTSYIKSCEEFDQRLYTTIMHNNFTKDSSFVKSMCQANRNKLALVALAVHWCF